MKADTEMQQDADSVHPLEWLKQMCQTEHIHADDADLEQYRVQMEKTGWKDGNGKQIDNIGGHLRTWLKYRHNHTIRKTASSRQQNERPSLIYQQFENVVDVLLQWIPDQLRLMSDIYSSQEDLMHNVELHIEELRDFVKRGDLVSFKERLHLIAIRDIEYGKLMEDIKDALGRKD